jgi:hypothetical protein
LNTNFRIPDILVRQGIEYPAFNRAQAGGLTHARMRKGEAEYEGNEHAILKD